MPVTPLLLHQFAQLLASYLAPLPADAPPEVRTLFVELREHSATYLRAVLNSAELADLAEALCMFAGDLSRLHRDTGAEQLTAAQLENLARWASNPERPSIWCDVRSAVAELVARRNREGGVVVQVPGHEMFIAGQIQTRDDSAAVKFTPNVRDVDLIDATKPHIFVAAPDPTRRPGCLLCALTLSSDIHAHGRALAAAAHTALPARLTNDVVNGHATVLIGAGTKGDPRRYQCTKCKREFALMDDPGECNWRREPINVGEKIKVEGADGAWEECEVTLVKPDDFRFRCLGDNAIGTRRHDEEGSLWRRA